MVYIVYTVTILVSRLVRKPVQHYQCQMHWAPQPLPTNIVKLKAQTCGGQSIQYNNYTNCPIDDDFMNTGNFFFF